jgi:hypothetical protein
VVADQPKRVPDDQAADPEARKVSGKPRSMVCTSPVVSSPIANFPGMQSLADHKVELASELLADIELGRIPADKVLPKASRLVRLIGDEDVMKWLGHELYGYNANDELSLTYMGWTDAIRSAAAPLRHPLTKQARLPDPGLAHNEDDATPPFEATVDASDKTRSSSLRPTSSGQSTDITSVIVRPGVPVGTEREESVAPTPPR